MWKFKEQFKNQTVVLSSGMQVNAANATQKDISSVMKSAPGVAFMFEQVEAKKEAKPSVVAGTKKESTKKESTKK